jgi:hypothetical protein
MLKAVHFQTYGFPNETWENQSADTLGLLG